MSSQVIAAVTPSPAESDPPPAAPPKGSEPSPGVAARPDPPVERDAPASGRSRWRRRAAILCALFAGVAVATWIVLAIGASMSERFAAQLAEDLEWRAVRGAQELSQTSALALVASQTDAFNRAIDAFVASPDVQAVALELDGKVLASDGAADVAPVFEAEPGTLVRGDGYLASWAPAANRGIQLGKVAVLVSTRRLAEAQVAQDQLARRIEITGIATALLGALVVLWLTRNAGGQTIALAPVDAAVEAPAPAVAAGPSLEEQLEDATRELDERNRSLRLVLDNTVQGFLMVELGGRLTRDRSMAIDRWFGEPGPEVTLADYMSQHNRQTAAQLGRGLESICEGIAPVEQCLEEMPKQLAADGRTFEIQYAALLQGDRPERILLMFSDITERVERERVEREAREQRELSTLTQLISGNRSEFDEFFAEIAGLISSLDAPSELEAQRKTVRTLKDNCAYYGLDTYVALCAKVEAEIGDERPMTDAHRIALADGWGRIASQLARQLAA